ncbi:hypothetical protein ACFOZ5_05765 [Marinobacter lacisalsi]|uniref:Peptidase M10 metallopeptidase domain-containing protein n=1 Tax=Marinobacter lacisalsi TaxID=475979 RepID=A0ABV8QG70_9GAMM
MPLWTLTHEIGHALGLDHPRPAGQVMGLPATCAAFNGFMGVSTTVDRSMAPITRLSSAPTVLTSQ